MINRTGVSILSSVVVAVFLVQFCIFTQKAWGEEEETCVVPSSAVKITVKQDGDMPVYEFTVTNNYDKPIYVICIGLGPKGGLRYLRDIVPNKFISPEGWEGLLGGAESPYKYYFWSVKMNDSNYRSHMIMPGFTLSSFKLVMREPLDIIKLLQFKVRFSGGRCAYGTVVEVK